MSTIHYNFVGSSASGDDLDFLRALPWEEGTIMCARHAWVWPLYCQLKMRGMLVSFSFELKEGAVNFIHAQIARTLLKADNFSDFFIVGIRGDYRAFPYGEYEIVQNMHTARGRSIYMPHYPQPGLIPRANGRSEVVNVCFSGQSNNFCLDGERFVKDLKKVGCQLVIREYGEWQQMKDVDILLGIRSLSKNPYHDKPPTKLINAWLAGIPFIGGYDSAYEQIGTPGVDYLRVDSYQDLIDAVMELKRNPEKYMSMVDAGRKAVANYTVERTTEQWVSLFKHQIGPAYEAWSDNTGRKPLRSRMMGPLFAMDRIYHSVRGVLR